MKRFWEYGFEKRRKKWEENREDYDIWVADFKDDPEPGDSEKGLIALVLQELGDMAGAREAAESIVDEPYRKETLFWLDKHEAETANPWVCVD